MFTLGHFVVNLWRENHKETGGIVNGSFDIPIMTIRRSGRRRAPSFIANSSLSDDIVDSAIVGN
jgi:hypothetical protein